MKNQKSKIKNQKYNLKLKSKKTFAFLLAILPFAFCLLNVSASKASAEEQVLRVSPIIINIPLSPGKIYEHEITVENMTEAPLPLRASLSDFQTTGEEGGYVFAEAHTNPLLSWITLSDTDIILNPKEKKTILATITTPANIPLGGYYGMLFFEVVPQIGATEVTRVVPKIGVLMLANVGVPDPNAKKTEILNFTTGIFHQTNQIPLLLRVKNVSLHYFTAKPILTISPLIPFPQSQEETHYLEEKIIFQGNVRRWEQNLTVTDTKPNIYKAHLVLSTGNGQFVTEDKYFVIFPLLEITIGTLIIITILFIIKKRKRLGKAIQALIK